MYKLYFYVWDYSPAVYCSITTFSLFKSAIFISQKLSFRLKLMVFLFSQAFSYICLAIKYPISNFRQKTQNKCFASSNVPCFLKRIAFIFQNLRTKLVGKHFQSLVVELEVGGFVNLLIGQILLGELIKICKACGILTVIIGGCSWSDDSTAKCYYSFYHCFASHLKFKNSSRFHSCVH